MPNSPVDHGLRIDAGFQKEELAVGFQGRELPAERFGVLPQGIGTFLERDEDARLAGQRAAVEEFQAEHRLARARAADDQRRMPGRQTAMQDRVETGYPGRRLAQAVHLVVLRMRRHVTCIP
ncbi:MAG TPA: hypothetical protein VF816_15150 [Rhodocyclaceae bacterium]